MLRSQLCYQGHAPNHGPLDDREFVLQIYVNSSFFLLISDQIKEKYINLKDNLKT